MYYGYRLRTRSKLVSCSSSITPLPFTVLEYRNENQSPWSGQCNPLKLGEIMTLIEINAKKARLRSLGKYTSQ